MEGKGLAELRAGLERAGRNLAKVTHPKAKEAFGELVARYEAAIERENELTEACRIRLGMEW